jgi:hypothetical protein
VDPDIQGELDRYYAIRADQPFGDTESVSGRVLQPFSLAGQQAAANLLTKAVRALDDGDDVRARALVDRACRLPYDRHEETHPAASEAQMMLFCLVTDTLEDSYEGDTRWLDAAATSSSVTDEVGRAAIRHVLADVDNDYELSRSEHRALRAAIAGLPVRAELHDLRLPPGEIVDVVMSVIETCRAYRAAI